MWSLHIITLVIFHMYHRGGQDSLPKRKFLYKLHLFMIIQSSKTFSPIWTSKQLWQSRTYLVYHKIYF